MPSNKKYEEKFYFDDVFHCILYRPAFSTAQKECPQWCYLCVLGWGLFWIMCLLFSIPIWIDYYLFYLDISIKYSYVHSHSDNLQTIFFFFAKHSVMGYFSNTKFISAMFQRNQVLIIFTNPRGTRHSMLLLFCTFSIKRQI